MMKFAGNQLFGLGKERLALATVEIDPQNHTLSTYAPMGKEEQPFTQWLGGTFILSEKDELSPIKGWQTLNCWIEQLAASPATTRKRVLYVWHTPETNLNNPVSHLTRL